MLGFCRGLCGTQTRFGCSHRAGVLTRLPSRSPALTRDIVQPRSGVTAHIVGQEIVVITGGEGNGARSNEPVAASSWTDRTSMAPENGSHSTSVLKAEFPSRDEPPADAGDSSARPGELESPTF